MLALADLQDAFRRSLLGDDDPALAAAVLDDGLDPAARLRIYRHHVSATLTAVLASAYPVVRRLVDPRFFAYAADAFIRRHPPAGPCLHEYGADFAEFLAAFPPVAHLPYLPDAARLEWAIQAAWHAEDAGAVGPAALAAVPAEEIPEVRLRLDPSIAYVASPWPVDRIWRANQGDAEPDAVELDAGAARLEVRRVEDEVVFRPLEPAAFAFRRALAAGGTLEDAAEAALGLDEAFDLPAAIAALMAEGVVVGLVRPGAAGATAP